jgi:drug/metabolite transporter (DMT)-like permease
MKSNDKNNKINNKKGALFALSSSLAYGFNNPLAALGAHNGIPTIYSAAFRAMIMLLISSFVLKSTKQSFYLPKDARKDVTIMAITTTLISLCYVGSINFISVSLAAIIFFTFPIQIMIYSIVFKNEKLQFIEIFVFIFIFLGLTLVITPDLNNINLIGVLLAFISSISATFLYFSGSVAAKKSNPFLIGFWMHLLAFPIIALISFAIYNFVEITSLKMLYPMVLMAACYVLAYYFQILSLKYTTPIISSLFFNAEPIMTGIAAAIILKEKLMPVQYLGAILVFSALVINSLRKKI